MSRRTPTGADILAIARANPDVVVLDDDAPPVKLSRSKFNAVVCTVDGIKFDSKKEAARYSQLKLMEAAGTIIDLETQPRYVIREAFRDATGRKHRQMVYTPDFRYKEAQRPSVIVVEEVKGGRATQTEAFRIRMRLFLERYPDVDYRIV